MSTAAELNQFLLGIEKRAFRMAVMAVSNADDALDIVQDAMMMLAKKYSDRPQQEWRPLFYKILHNRITDTHRRRATKQRWFGWLDRRGGDEDEAETDVFANVPGREQQNPDVRLALDDASAELERAVAGLPARQREAFMMRVWEGLDVRDTAQAMGCSEGSVKTHYSRAVHTLREELQEHWS